MTVRIYFGVENLNLNDEQRDTLVDALRLLGPGSDPQPAHLNHWRVRTDGQAAIFEALFDEDHITVQAFKNRLGAIFGVDPSTITHTVANVTFAARVSVVVTFRRNAVNYLRCVFFGYGGTDWPTWEQSRAECVAYLRANAAAWGEG